MLAGAVSVYSQGLVTFADYSGAMQQQVFGYQSSAPTSGGNPIASTSVTLNGYTVSEYQGSTAAANELSPGTTVYAANTALSGTGFDAQLLAAAGSGDSIGSLTAQGGILHFNTTASSVGFAKGSSAVTLGAGQSGAITVAFAAWVINAGGDKGAATTLAQAQADALADAAENNDGGYAWGVSTTANLTVNNSLPTAMPQSIQGFSLGQAASTPEPSTIALGVIVVSTLLFRRRK